MKKIYTKKGDGGLTIDYLKKVLPKDNPRIIANGKVDTLQAIVDLAILESNKQNKFFLSWIQKKLWQLAAEIAGALPESLSEPITEFDLAKLEQYTDLLGQPPQNFVRFKNKKSIIYNEARVRCRELEIALTKLLRKKEIRPIAYAFVNRLSSFFFMLAYSVNKEK